MQSFFCFVAIFTKNSECFTHTCFKCQVSPAANLFILHWILVKFFQKNVLEKVLFKMSWVPVSGESPSFKMSFLSALKLTNCQLHAFVYYLIPHAFSWICISLDTEFTSHSSLNRLALAHPSLHYPSHCWCSYCCHCFSMKKLSCCLPFSLFRSSHSSEHIIQVPSSMEVTPCRRKRSDNELQ